MPADRDRCHVTGLTMECQPMQPYELRENQTQQLECLRGISLITMITTNGEYNLSRLHVCIVVRVSDCSDNRCALGTHDDNTQAD